MSSAADVLEELLGLADKAAEKDPEFVEKVLAATRDRVWFPNPGPQSNCTYSDADVIFYGGTAGGGKSSLLCGLAHEFHQRSLILRRTRIRSEKLADEELLGRILGSRDGWNGQKLLYRDQKRYIQFEGCEHESDKEKFKGDPYDFYGIDEICDFSQSQFEFVTIWNRSSAQDQRCRIVCAGNPPTTADGLWVIQYWGPWLDPQNPLFGKVKPGELVWYLRDDNGDYEVVDGPGPYKVGNRMVKARSRTFIPAELADNPDLAMDGEYERMLDSLPKELRDAYRDGNFQTSIKDDPFQLIPTSWFLAANERWQQMGGRPDKGVPMCSLACDIAQSKDNNVLAPRYDNFIGELIVIPGSETPKGISQAGIIASHRRDGCQVAVDVGGGYGDMAVRDLKENEDWSEASDVYGWNGATEPRSARDPGSKLKFKNLRDWGYWQLRLALDPNQKGGAWLALPPDNELMSDLTSLTFEPRNGFVGLITKENHVKKLGRSPDRGDTVMMAYNTGFSLQNMPKGKWRSPTSRTPKAVLNNPAGRRGKR